MTGREPVYTHTYRNYFLALKLPGWMYLKKKEDGLIRGVLYVPKGAAGFNGVLSALGVAS